MNISGRCDYACRAMLELALHYETGQPIPAQTIAGVRNIPEKYLTHILLQLKRARLAKSTRGAQGGYALSKPPREISLCDIIEAIDGPILAPTLHGNEGSNEPCSFWPKIAANVIYILQEITLSDMLDMTQKNNMFHI